MRMMRARRSRNSVKKTSQIPYSRKPDHLSFEEWQIGLRRQFALTQKFIIKNTGNHPVYSDFEGRVAQGSLTPTLSQILTITHK